MKDEPGVPMASFLAALADPVRLEMLRRLAGAGGPVACGAVYDGIAKSTASHHFRVLQAAGIIATSPAGTGRNIELALDELPTDRRMVLSSVLSAL